MQNFETEVCYRFRILSWTQNAELTHAKKSRMGRWKDLDINIRIYWTFIVSLVKRSWHDVRHAVVWTTTRMHVTWLDGYVLQGERDLKEIKIPFPSH